MNQPPPTHLPPEFQPVRLLGEGGMGRVWEVVHTQTGGRYALKQVLQAEDDDRVRFEREAVAAAQLRSPHVVTVHASGVVAGHPYLVQELATGGSLQDRLRRGPLPWEQAREVLLQVARGVAAAHAAGLLHRDLKPDNVLFSDEGVAKVADFGLARVEGERERLTRTGVILGTPEFMAPEQAADARSVDARADVYALGGILYAALTGRPPVESKSSIFMTLVALEEEPPPPPRSLAPDVPAWLDALCLRALAKDPDRRPASAQAFLEALEAGPAGVAGGGRGLGGVALLTLLLLSAGGLATFVARGQIEPTPTPSTPPAGPSGTAAASPTPSRSAPELPNRLELEVRKARVTGLIAGDEVYVCDDRSLLRLDLRKQEVSRLVLAVEVAHGSIYVHGANARHLFVGGRDDPLYWLERASLERQRRGLAHAWTVLPRTEGAFVGDTLGYVRSFDGEGVELWSLAPAPEWRRVSVYAIAALDEAHLAVALRPNDEQEEQGNDARGWVQVVSFADPRAPRRVDAARAPGASCLASRGGLLYVGTRLGGLSTYALGPDRTLQLREAGPRWAITLGEEPPAVWSLELRGEALYALRGKTPNRRRKASYQLVRVDPGSNTGALLGLHELPSRPRSLAFSPTGRKALVCGDEGLVEVVPLPLPLPPRDR